MPKSESLNPFALGGVVRGDRFAGRRTEISRLRALARGGHRAYLFAPRRYGKTSLLREALEPEAEAGHLSLLWCDCLPTVDATSLTARIAEAVVRAARRGQVAAWAKTAGRFFTRLRPTLSVGSEGEVSISVAMAPDSLEPGPALEDALEAIGRLARAKGKPVAVVFDELQQIAEWDRDHRVEAIMRTTIQHQEGVAYIFAGSQRHLLQEMFSDRRRPLFKLATPFPLGRLTPEELTPWLTERFGTTGFELRTEGRGAVIGTVEGHPWAAQYLAHFVWEAAVRSGSDEIGEEVVRAGLDLALATGDTIYAAEFSSLTSAQRHVLTAIAAQPTRSPTAADYLRRHRLPAKSTVSQALASLARKGQVEIEAETYRLADPLFGRWLGRQ